MCRGSVPLIFLFRVNKDGGHHVHSPLNINEERVANFKYLGTHISVDLTWTTNPTVLVKKALQRLYFLRLLKKAYLSQQILESFSHSLIESVLTYGILV